MGNAPSQGAAGQLSEPEARALLEEHAVCSTVFTEYPYTSPKAMMNSLRRIEKATRRCESTFGAAPVFGRGEG
jgi:hypothetical protein